MIRRGKRRSLPARNIRGAFSISWKGFKARALNAPTSPSSHSRPVWRTFSRKTLWNARMERASGFVFPSRSEITRSTSISPSMSKSLGQRVEQVSQEAHTQMVLDRSALSRSPSWTKRTT